MLQCFDCDMVKKMRIVCIYMLLAETPLVQSCMTWCPGRFDMGTWKWLCMKHSPRVWEDIEKMNDKLWHHVKVASWIWFIVFSMFSIISTTLHYWLYEYYPSIYANHVAIHLLTSERKSGSTCKELWVYVAKIDNSSCSIKTKEYLYPTTCNAKACWCYPSEPPANNHFHAAHSHSCVHPVLFPQSSNLQ